MTKKSLADAQKVLASTKKAVAAAKDEVTKKTTDREDARADKDTDAAGKLAWDTSDKALTNAQSNQQFQEKA